MLRNNILEIKAKREDIALRLDEARLKHETFAATAKVSVTEYAAVRSIHAEIH